MKKKLSSLRFKLLVFILAAVLLLFAVLFFSARENLLKGYSQLETDKTLIQLNSAESLLKEQSDQLSTVTRDYAHWDDTYNFIDKPDQKYIKSNLNDVTFSNLKINAIILINLKGEIVFKKGIDFNTGKPWHIAQELEQAIALGGTLVNLNVNNLSGLMWTSEGVVVVSAYDILDSELTKNRRGTLIMVRPLNEALIKHINKILNASLEVQYSKQFNPNIGSNLAANKSVEIQLLNVSKITGAKAIKDISGSENLILRVIDDREIFKQGNASLGALYWSAALVGLMLLIYSWLVDKVVLKRLQGLYNSVKSIGSLTSSNARVEYVEGLDEIASLGHGINAMLGRLDESQYALVLEKSRSQITLSTLSGIADAVITCDGSANVSYLNDAAETLLGISGTDAQGKPLESFVHLMAEDNLTTVNSDWLIDNESPVTEVALLRADGRRYVINKSSSRLYDTEGVFFGTVTVLHDVTSVRQLTKQLSYQASHDLLTGLVNRYEFERKVQEAIEDSIAQNRTHCLAFIDLDQFKLVNDTCGHMAGDCLLKQLSNELKANMRGADTLARLGGDEFAILLMGCSLDSAQLLLNDILTLVSHCRFHYENKLFNIAASIGLTEISPSQPFTLNELFVVADAACYQAKHLGGNRIQQYMPKESELRIQSQQFEWLAHINFGLENKLFVLYMQRIQSLTGDQRHCEILIRMKGDGGSLYLPGVFLPVAERYKLMPKIDRWVVIETFTILASKGDSFPYICAINLSGQTLSDENFLDFVLDQLKVYGINPNQICFEITETAVISNLDRARQFIHALREIGCHFSLDDFGSGLSSFAYLKNLEVDFLKIDGMFVKAIVNNKIDRAMVESINNVGHVMGLHTIAEFAENDEIINMLKEIGVDYAQGYGVAKPELFE